MALAAPHLPIQAISLVSMVVGIYVCTTQGIEQLSTKWIETSSTKTSIGEVYERTQEDKPEYVFKISYEYEANGKTFNINEEKAYVLKHNAELGHKVNSRKNRDVPIWYDMANPDNAQLENRINGYAVLSLNLIFIGMILYFRWFLLKYYELEIEEKAEPNIR